MTPLDTDAEGQRRETDVISQADRYALLKMLDEKPRVIIANVLREAARRGMFTDKMLDSGSSPSRTGRVFKAGVLGALLLALGALGYVGSRDAREYMAREYLARFQSFQQPRSVMGITPNDAAKTATKAEEEKNDIAYARLSEPVRNAFKNHLPEAGLNTRPDIKCASAIRPDDRNSADKIAPQLAQKGPSEPANKWIERMTTLNKAGKKNELQAELKKFRQAYPSATLPMGLQALAC